MSDDTKKNDRELTDNEMEKVSGGVTAGSFAVRGGGSTGQLAKISDGEGTLSEFVPKLTTR